VKRLALLLAGLPAGSAAASAVEPAQAGRIFFLRGAEVWSADLAGGGAAAVTRTGGKVDAYEVSPDGRYLAYQRVLEYVEEAGESDEGEEVPQRAVSSVVVMDLAARRVLKEIPPSEDVFLYVDRVTPGGSVILHTAGHFDVSGFLEYDIVRGVQRELDYARWSALATRADFAPDGSLVAYADENGALRLLDTRTGVDRMLPAKRGAVDVALSPDRTRIAYVEVERGESVKRDRLWLYDLKAQRATEAWSGPVRPKPGQGGLAWSPDGTRVGLFWGPEAVVVDPRKPGTAVTLRGTEFAWLDAGRLLVGDGKDLHAHRLAAGKPEVLVRNATRARVVAAGRR
jgi:dipeptidyl aminopeptidase/acylaminoacyl peptidase